MNRYSIFTQFSILFSFSLLTAMLIGCADEEEQADQVCSVSDNGDDSYTIHCPESEPITIGEGVADPSGGGGGDSFQQARELYSSYRRGVVRIKNGCASRTQTGTGFRIADNIIAANEHLLMCRDGSARTYLSIYRLDPTKDSLLAENGRYAKIALESSDYSLTVHPDFDMAKIDISSAGQSQRDKINELPLLPYETSADTATGTPTLVMGYPVYGYDLLSNIGTIVSNNSAVNNSYDFSVSNDMDVGASGSPIFNVNTGKVEGIYTAGWERDRNDDGDNDLAINLGLAISASRLGDSFICAADVNWTLQTSGVSEDLNAVAAIAARLVAAGDSGLILTSDDSGTSWESRKAGTDEDLNGVAVAADRLIAVGDSGVILTSDDRGVSWTLRKSGAGSDIMDAVAVGDRLMAVGHDGVILISDDNGVSWSLLTLSEPLDLNAIAALGNDLVIVGKAGTVLIGESSGSVWRRIGVDTKNDLWGAAAYGSYVLAVGSNGTLLIIHPASSTVAFPMSGTASHLWDVAAVSGNRLLAVGDRGTLLSGSQKGRNWIPYRLDTSSHFRGAALAGNRLLAVGSDGAILTRSLSGDCLYQ